MADQDNTFPDKWLKKLPDGWVDTANSMQEEELKKAIVEAEGNIYVIDRAKQDDDKLSAAKEIVKDHSAPYRDAKNCQNAKIKYALWLLEGRGVDLDTQNNDV
jgi:hypothetical protein